MRHEEVLAWKRTRDEAVAERDDLWDKLGDTMALANTLEAERDEAREQRDHWIRLFNRLEAAISHHKRDSGFADANDESLWYARDRILKEASGPIPED